MEKQIDPFAFEAIIFDLGGVLLNIDYKASKTAFENLGVKDFDLHFSQLNQSELFDRFETGKISSGEFREKIRKEAQIHSSDSQIDAAWNAMLLDFPLRRIALLENLANKIPLYLFSNSNEIHIRLFKERLLNLGLLQRFENSFQHLYYSYELGLRKPHPESFLHIVTENKLVPGKTLFIDDSIQHIEGAKMAGLEALFLPSTMDITTLFKL
jgi:putative hydrolase of the HAD superfamily